jgi:hypothetical protein
VNISYFTFAQTADTSKHILNIKGTTSVTNNGFSFIPSFSLGKPAAIFNFNINAGKRFSFDPEFRFSLIDGRPWSFIFIWRYKIIDQKQFQFTAGMHYPAVPFRVLAYQTTPIVKNTLATSRVIPIEMTPNVVINKYLSISLFYLYAKGISDDAIQNTNFINLRAVISNIKLSNNLLLRVNPQLFYLQMDDKDGFYFASNFAISSPKTPFFIGATINKPLKTDIIGKKFDWNISLAYSFGHSYVRQ